MHALEQVAALRNRPTPVDSLKAKRPDVDGSWGSSSLLSGMLNQVDYPIFLVEADGRVRHANIAGCQAAAAADAVLRLEADQLRAARPSDVDALRSAISAAARQGSRRLLEIGAAGNLVMVAVVPLTNELPLPSGVMALHRPVIVVTGRSRGSEAAAMRWFAAQHGLTPAETRVLQSLLDGLAPKAIAVRHGVSIGTVRTQLSSLRAKTGAENLRAVVRQAGKLPPMPPILGLV